jgi:acetoin utilization protein AcuC
VVFDDELTEYDFGPSHPLAPLRIKLTMALATELGVIEAVLPRRPGFVADDDLIATVHSRDYIRAVRGVDGAGDAALSYGLGTADNPTFAGMHRAAAHVVGAGVAAARLVWTGEVLHAVNLCGGLHHAMPGAASGFCVYNDVAVAIRWLLDQGARRVAYVDVDVHHGDGVQEVFYDEPRVLTVSLHESPYTLFPGTGWPSETGGPLARGSAVNVALPAGTGDAGWLRAFHAVVPALLREFAPDVLVTQHGCDSHLADPLAHLMLSVDGQRASYLALHDLAHELCRGRWLATGGGGYAVKTVVPRSWSHLLAIAGGQPLDPARELPSGWVPRTLSDGRDARYRDWSGGYDPADELDRAVLATRSAVFPLHGLDPMP